MPCLNEAVSGRGHMEPQACMPGLDSVMTYPIIFFGVGYYWVIVRIKIEWWWWRRTPIIPALKRKRQENLCQFETSLVYKASSRTARTIAQKYSVSQNQTAATQQQQE